jgi:diamine N-acetyltransferase
MLFIRQAVSGDSNVIADLSARTFISAYQGMLHEEALQGFVRSAFSHEKIQEEMDLPGNQFLLAYEDETPIGYAFLREAGPPMGVQGEKPVELARIYLEEDVTGKGYGSRLMEACIELAIQSGYSILWLGVWEQNERAIRFYEKMGFNQAGTLPFLFGDDLHTDRVMVLSISND